ncbi:MAG: DNA polymerase III subunit delta [Verrucomicrobiae bacterium]|nr:DNA polymerase III subunit delta [Verrucomicrobiae bacterium]
MQKNNRDLPPVVLIVGTDEFLAKERARQIFETWSAEDGVMDKDIIDASVNSQEEALKTLARLQEALNTFPFFGSRRIIWLKDCNFLSDSSSITNDHVWKRLDDLAKIIKTHAWKDTKLVINAEVADKRRTFYKAISEVGKIETFDALSVQDPDWETKAVEYIRNILEENKKHAPEDVLLEIINRIGADTAMLRSEAEKLIIYSGARNEIRIKDVEEICSTNKQAQAFAVADAIGKRDLAEALRRLDEEFWSMQFDKEKSEIGILYGIISKFRAMLVAKDLIESKTIKSAINYPSFKKQIESSLLSNLSSLKIHPFVLFKACEECKNYSRAELVEAMYLLLQCNHELVSTQQDKKLLLQQTLVKILSKYD